MGCVVAVPQDKVFIVEKFGKFERTASPGFLCLPLPCVWSIAGSLSTRIQQVYVDVQTKTRDNVFVSVTVAIQYAVLDDDKSKYDAFYKLYNPAHQIQSMVEDVVRAAVPTIELDNVFLEKHHIAGSVQDALKKDMEGYGYRIVAALVTDITPDTKVKASMNEINARRRQRIAQTERAEAAKFVQIKAAEGDAESTYLQGEGIARQRCAIVEGLRTSVEELSEDLGQVEPREVLDLMMVTQYLDALRDIAQGDQTSLVLAPKRKKADLEAVFTNMHK